MIQKIIIFILVTTVSHFGFAQKDSAQYQMKRFYFGVFYNPKIEFRDFENKPRSATLERSDLYYKTLSYSPKNDKIIFEHSLGLSANIKIYKGLRFNLGISFNKNVYQTNVIDTAHIYIHDGLSLSQDEKYDEVNVYKLKQEKVFFSLSPTLKYYFKINKIWYINIGIGLSLSRWQSEYFSYNESNSGWKTKTVPPPSNGNLYAISYTAEIGITYLTKNKHLISISPDFKYYIPNNQSQGFKKKFYYCGVNLSFSF